MQIKYRVIGIIDIYFIYKRYTKTVKSYPIVLHLITYIQINGHLLFRVPRTTTLLKKLPPMKPATSKSLTKAKAFKERNPVDAR